MDKIDPVEMHLLPRSVPIMKSEMLCTGWTKGEKHCILGWAMLAHSVSAKCENSNCQIGNLLRDRLKDWNLVRFNDLHVEAGYTQKVCDLWNDTFESIGYKILNDRLVKQ